MTKFCEFSKMDYASIILNFIMHSLYFTTVQMEIVHFSLPVPQESYIWHIRAPIMPKENPQHEFCQILFLIIVLNIVHILLSWVSGYRASIWEFDSSLCLQGEKPACVALSKQHSSRDISKEEILTIPRKL